MLRGVPTRGPAVPRPSTELAARLTRAVPLRDVELMTDVLRGLGDVDLVLWHDACATPFEQGLWLLLGYMQAFTPLGTLSMSEFEEDVESGMYATQSTVAAELRDYADGVFGADHSCYVNSVVIAAVALVLSRHFNFL